MYNSGVSITNCFYSRQVIHRSHFSARVTFNQRDISSLPSTVPNSPGCVDGPLSLLVPATKEPAFDHSPLPSAQTFLRYSNLTALIKFNSSCPSKLRLIYQKKLFEIFNIFNSKWISMQEENQAKLQFCRT